MSPAFDVLLVTGVLVCVAALLVLESRTTELEQRVGLIDARTRPKGDPLNELEQKWDEDQRKLAGYFADALAERGLTISAAA